MMVLLTVTLTVLLSVVHAEAYTTLDPRHHAPPGPSPKSSEHYSEFQGETMPHHESEESIHDMSDLNAERIKHFKSHSLTKSFTISLP